MSPTDPARRRGAPSVAEIAALTRRLRELSAQGRDADPAERAAFLADKDALLARIAEAHSDPDTGRAVLPADGAGREIHSHRAPVGRVDDTAPQPTLASHVDARFLIEGDRFERDGIVHVVDDVPIPYDEGLIVPTRAGDEATWVELPAGGWVTLHEEQEARREQLARWHDDDAAGTDAVVGDDTVGVDQNDAGDLGWSR